MLSGQPNIFSVDYASKQPDIEFLHKRLMIAYVYAIEAISSPGRLPKGAERSENGMVRKSRGDNFQQEYLLRSLHIYRRRPIARNLVESHIKGKLRELRAAYVQIEQVVPDVDSTQVFRNWLRDTQDSLSRFLITLTVMAAIRRIMTVLWPLVVALVAVSAV
jgi:hypothetical protein